MKNLSLMLLILSLSLSSGCAWLGWDDEEPTEQDSAGLTEKDFYEKITLPADIK